MQKVKTVSIMLDKERILAYGMTELKKLSALTKRELIQGHPWISALTSENLSSVLLILLERSNPMTLEELESSYGIDDLERIITAITELVAGKPKFKVLYEKYGNAREKDFYDEDEAYAFAADIDGQLVSLAADPTKTPASGLSVASTSA